MLSLLLICVAGVASVPLEYNLPLEPLSLHSGPYPEALPYPAAVPVVLEEAPIPTPVLFAPIPPPPTVPVPHYPEIVIGHYPEEIPVVTGPYPEAIPEIVHHYAEAIPISVGPYPEALPIEGEAVSIVTGPYLEAIPVVADPYPEAIPVVADPYPEAIPVVTGPYPEAIPVVTGPYAEALPVMHDEVYDPSSDSLVLPVGTRVDVRDGRGQFSTGFSSPDGTKISEEGRLITTNGGWEYVIAKTGSYSYVSPEGKLIEVNWVADENGFRHLP